VYQCIAVAAAMERELGFLRPVLNPPSPLKPRIASGTMAGKTIYLLRTGIGPAKTVSRLAELEKTCRPQCVISIGCAGALEPSLVIGEAVVADKLIDDSDGGKIWSATPALIDMVGTCCERAGVKHRTGSTVSTDSVAATPEHKEKLARIYGALAVDMESARVASWAAASNIPMLSIRTISDSAADSLPPELSGMFDRDGNIRLLPALASLAAKPSILSRMYRLQTNFTKSIDALARIMLSLLDSL